MPSRGTKSQLSISSVIVSTFVVERRTFLFLKTLGQARVLFQLTQCWERNPWAWWSEYTSSIDWQHYARRLIPTESPATSWARQSSSFPPLGRPARCPCWPRRRRPWPYSTIDLERIEGAQHQSKSLPTSLARKLLHLVILGLMSVSSCLQKLNFFIKFNIFFIFLQNPLCTKKSSMQETTTTFAIPYRPPALWICWACGVRWMARSRGGLGPRSTPAAWTRPWPWSGSGLLSTLHIHC